MKNGTPTLRRGFWSNKNGRRHSAMIFGRTKMAADTLRWFLVEQKWPQTLCDGFWSNKNGRRRSAMVFGRTKMAAGTLRWFLVEQKWPQTLRDGFWSNKNAKKTRRRVGVFPPGRVVGVQKRFFETDLEDEKVDVSSDGHRPERRDGERPIPVDDYPGGGLDGE
ncbi:MAG TPA: hypothetical protein H9848_03825 [Candidatus Parabacteroides intestinigallinarum]|uniref:Uncharacterized protein n=1 Tax=Candidatus Parabacteroides intestinigallinarum TaxID=2838722 RepID=A0A9D2BQC3_9BACT|nr:hypothetical protein [Candidatus Parabacteroides intestinigallinarum]